MLAAKILLWMVVVDCSLTVILSASARSAHCSRHSLKDQLSMGRLWYVHGYTFKNISFSQWFARGIRSAKVVEVSGKTSREMLVTTATWRRIEVCVWISEWFNSLNWLHSASVVQTVQLLPPLDIISLSTQAVDAAKVSHAHAMDCYINKKKANLLHTTAGLNQPQ
jgi:hypothetical protein